MNINYWNKGRRKWKNYKNPRLMELLAEMRRHDLAELEKRKLAGLKEVEDGPDTNGWCESYWR